MKLKKSVHYCRYEAGIPTYDGRYSNNKSPDYAISGLSCQQEDIENCKFHTICGKDNPLCLTQQSIRQFGGSGYAFNKGNNPDIAGVVCGNKKTIAKLMKDTAE